VPVVVAKPGSLWTEPEQLMECPSHVARMGQSEGSHVFAHDAVGLRHLVQHLLPQLDDSTLARALPCSYVDFYTGGRLAMGSTAIGREASRIAA